MESHTNYMRKHNSKQANGANNNVVMILSPCFVGDSRLYGHSSKPYLGRHSVCESFAIDPTVVSTNTFLVIKESRIRC